MMNNLRPIAITDLCSLNLISDLQMSPSGKHVSFVVTVASSDDDKYQSNIWLVELESGEVRKLTNGPKTDSSPRWSPDGKRIAFISNRLNQNQIWIINIAGGEATQLTNMSESVSEPMWSPSGEYMTFTAMPQKQESADKDSKVKVIKRLRYRLNGKGILDDRRKHVWVISASGGAPKQLTDGDWDDSMPAWHPNSQEIAFLSNRTSDRDYNNVNDIWLVGIDGAETRKLTKSSGPIESFSWSPNGGQIAFIGNDRVNELGTHQSLWIVESQTGRARDVIPLFEHDVNKTPVSTSWSGPRQRPIWTSSGDKVFFLASNKGSTHIFMTDLHGEWEQISDGDRACLSFVLGRSDEAQNLAYIVTAPTQPTEVFVCSLTGSNDHQLTKLNEEPLKEVDLARPEHFQYLSDGVPIDAWILKPSGFTLGQKYPVVLAIHGGPLLFYGNAFLFDEQLLAGAGYVVLLVNPRGSSGYSEDFATCLRGDLGGKDYEDLMRAVDHSLDFGFIDTSRMGVMGGSYGGYMTNRIITQTNRFQAAITEKSISNFVSLYGTTDATILDCDWFFMGMPQDNPTLYVDRSPINHIKNVRTPLLIIHGEEDLNCPIEQAEQLFIGLMRLGQEVEFVRFLGENHELNRSGSPQARIERLQRILDWFKRFLSPEP